MDLFAWYGSSESRRPKIRKRPIFNWAIFAVLVVVILAVAPAKIYVVKGKRNFAAGRYDQAIADYQQAIRSKPGFALAYVELGEVYRQLGKYDEAEKVFKTAISLDDESCASCGLGVVYWKTGRLEEAEKAFKRSIQLDPNDSCAYGYSGRMYYEQGRFADAVQNLEHEARLAPNFNGYLLLGDSCVNTGRYKAAVAAYKEALKSDPNDAKAHSGLARAYSGTGDKQAAQRHSRIATALYNSPRAGNSVAN
jgi:tetratricopeptide (TPR) repeat protein